MVVLSDDTRSSLVILVDLLNTAPGVLTRHESLRTPEDLTRFVIKHGITGDSAATVQDLAVAVQLRSRFAVALETDVLPTVAAINLTLREIRLAPQLVRHDGRDWHMHLASDSVSVGERLGADIAAGLTALIRTDGFSRLLSCSAEDCQAAFADLTKNRSKRFCDARNCANRVRGAAYRSRREPSPQPDAGASAEIRARI